MRIGSVIADRAVVNDVRASIGPELDVGRAVEPAASVKKCLIASGVASESLDLESWWPASSLVPLVVVVALVILVIAFSTRLLNEIDQLDLVPDFRGGRSGVRRRETEIAPEGVERRAGQHRSADKRPRDKIDSGERRICRLDRQ